MCQLAIFGLPNKKVKSLELFLTWLILATIRDIL